MKIIEENHIRTNGMCGTSIPQVMILLNKEASAIKESLLKLWKEKKVIIREGINGKLIFKNNK